MNWNKIRKTGDGSPSSSVALFSNSNSENRISKSGDGSLIGAAFSESNNN